MTHSTPQMRSEDEAAEARSQWVLKRRRRAVRNVWRILDSHIAAMARRARQQPRRRQPRQEQSGEANLVAEFRKQVALMAELAKLGGVDSASLEKAVKS